MKFILFLQYHVVEPIFGLILENTSMLPHAVLRKI
jgi:hypothetical protein